MAMIANPHCTLWMKCVPALAGVALQARRVPGDNAVIGDIAADNGSGADQTPVAEGDARKDNRARANGRTAAHDDRRDGPIIVGNVTEPQ